jgi:hypothetical protein
VTIPAAAYVSPLVSPNKGISFIDQKTGILTDHGYQVMNAVVGFLNGSNRIIPCNASGTNVITLTMLTTSPLIKQYNDFDTFRAVAANTTTGLVTALVVTPQGALGTIKVFKTNGSAQATTGDITSGLLYDFTFVDSLDSGNGGFVLR